MTDNITLRRWANTDDGPPKTKWQGGYDAARRWVREVALPALAEPEPEPTVKDSLTVDRIRSIWLDSWKACPNGPTPVLAEHFARQIERAHGIGLAKPTSKDSLQVASENEVEAMMPRPAKALEFLDGFRDGFRAAERFHGITKGDKT
jgi:hypothetical protein